MTDKKLKLQYIDSIREVTSDFAELLNKDIPLSELKKIVDNLVETSRPDALISVDISYNEWDDTEWNWDVVESRLETAYEHRERIKREKEQEKQQKRWEAEMARTEKKEYLRLKKKFEGK
jgi:hypothetical protein